MPYQTPLFQIEFFNEADFSFIEFFFGGTYFASVFVAKKWIEFGFNEFINFNGSIDNWFEDIQINGNCIGVKFGIRNAFSLQRM